MSKLTRAEKTYLSRRKCGLCDAPLWPMHCRILSAHDLPDHEDWGCTEMRMADRARRCLAERKRKKEASPT